jgi:hypothetical protein
MTVSTALEALEPLPPRNMAAGMKKKTRLRMRQVCYFYSLG